MDEAMKCPLCGRQLERDYYVLCKNCYEKMSNGEYVPIRYNDETNPGIWKVHTRFGWKPFENGSKIKPDPAFKKCPTLVISNELRFLEVIREALNKSFYGQDPKKYGQLNVFPQVALSSIVEKVNNGSKEYRSELFRSVDFLVTGSVDGIDYVPLIVIEINGNSHDDKDRKMRDSMVETICKEAGIPVVFINARNGVPLISADELCKMFNCAQFDITAKPSPSFYYRVCAATPSLRSRECVQLPNIQIQQEHQKVIFQPDTVLVDEKSADDMPEVLPVATRGKRHYIARVLSSLLSALAVVLATLCIIALVLSVGFFIKCALF